MRKAMMAICGAVVLAACGAEEAGTAISDFAEPGSTLVGPYDGTWSIAINPDFVRPAPEGAVSTAGYLSILSTRDDALVQATAPDFGVLELHEVTHDEGVSRMRLVERIALPANEAVSLSPGGYHLMMMAPTKVLADGDIVPVTLTFESGAKAEVALPVQMQDAGGMDHSGH